jgi:deoxyribodipyrimidine photo-lyase
VTVALVWFRRDLRLADNPALHAACTRADRVIPLYVWAPAEESPWEPGGASRWWLHHALSRLQDSLSALGNPLILRRAEATLDALRSLAAAHGVTHLYWNRLYDPATVARDKRIKAWAAGNGLVAESFKAGLLVEPWEAATGKGDPYRVFTPFWKSVRTREVADPLPAPTKLPGPPEAVAGDALESLRLLPRIRWDSGLAAQWEPGEPGAHAMLERFADEAIERYDSARDRPAEPATSRLSPYLHHGELSPRQALHLARQVTDEARAAPWLRQLYWREFAHHLLFHFPHTAEAPLDARFQAVEWSSDAAALADWQAGRTGIPIVDAGMRELWRTGWMHNRVRMLAASLLTKNLLQPWQAGARWFWDTLVDASLANNTLGWQWTAGCGADAAPYFRIFNPVLQGERFDPKGRYVRHWVPELAGLPDRWLHRPWEAPEDVLRQSGIRPGCDYPRPLVDLKRSRDDALAAWDVIKGAAPGGRNPPATA